MAGIGATVALIKALGNKTDQEIAQIEEDVTDVKTAIHGVNDGVVDLKEEIENYTEIALDAQPSGWRLNESNGLCHADENYKLNKYKVVAGKQVRIISDDRFQFQTVASVPSSGTSNKVGETYGAGKFFLIVPETATYLIMSTPVNDSQAVAYDITSKFPDIEDSIDDINNRFTIVNQTSRNLFDVSKMLIGKYYWNGSQQSSAGYNASDIIPVNPGDKIYLQTGGETAGTRSNKDISFVEEYNSNKVFVADKRDQNPYTVPASGVSFIRISSSSGNFAPQNNVVIFASENGTVEDYIPYFEPYQVHELKDKWINRRPETGLINRFNINSDNHGTTEELQDMFDYSILFRGIVTTFNGIIVAHGYNQTMGGHVEVTPTHFKYYLGSEAEPRLNEAHNLTIADYIAIRIDAKPDTKADFYLYTNGGTWSKTNQTWDVRKGQLSVRSSGTNVLTDCELSYFCKAWSKPIHMYGDSYFGVYSDKWTKYLVDAGYRDQLQNGYPGRQSAMALLVAKIVLEHSNPKKIIWCLGMNDGDDSSEVDASWKECVEELMTICESRSIELILATIPNVSTVDNTAKNAYVRDSGYRYIDFASAVGASEGTTWYTGMLSQDGVHPSTQGALALFNQALADVPELMQ